MLTPKGTYAGMCESIGPDTSKNGIPLLDIIFNIQQEMKNGEWQPLANPMQRHIRIWLSEKAWPTSEVKLEGLGFNGSFKTPEITADWVTLDCDHEMYEGKDLERWELSDWGGTAERTPPPDDVLRKLSARYKSKAALNPPPATPPPMPETPGAPVDEPSPPPKDSEIPF